MCIVNIINLNVNRSTSSCSFNSVLLQTQFLNKICKVGHMVAYFYLYLYFRLSRFSLNSLVIRLESMKVRCVYVYRLSMR